jgi:adenylyltransferase/sulfurtransferase
VCPIDPRRTTLRAFSRTNAQIVVHCKSGMRSAKAQKAMQEAGFTNVLNMKGGILAWSDKVDPKVPKY